MMRDAGVAINDKQMIRKRRLAVAAAAKIVEEALVVGKTMEANTERKNRNRRYDTIF